MGTSIIMTGGLGDVAVLQSHWTQYERDTLDTIYWGNRNPTACIGMFNNTDTYKHIKHVVLPTEGKVYFRIDEARKDHLIPEDVIDYSVLTQFEVLIDHPERFEVSTFLLDNKADVSRFDHLIDHRTVLIQHQTPDCEADSRALRDLDQADWDAIITRLEETKRNAIVVNSSGADNPPEHPRIVNLVGQTTMSESIALLNKVDAYWGIASSLCCLAAQRFSANRLWVKGPENWLVSNRYIYFRPHVNFPFLFKHLADKLPVIRVDTGMKLVKFQTFRIYQNELHAPGTIMQMSDKDAYEYIQYGHVKPFDPRPEGIDDDSLIQDSLIEADVMPVERVAARLRVSNDIAKLRGKRKGIK